MTSESLTLVPTWRLGALLHHAREQDGRSLDEVAAASHRFGVAVALGCAVAAAFSSGAGAVEVHDLKGFEQLFGRYAPAGDCKRQPQFVVDVSGFTFEVGGKTEKVTNPSSPPLTAATITAAVRCGSFRSVPTTDTRS